MKFTSKVLLAIQQAWLLCALLLVHQSCAMLDLFNEVHDRDASDQFIREFPNMTLTQANQKYSECSSGVSQKIQESIAAKNKSDLFFVKVFDIATKLPVDMHKKIAEHLLNNNAAAVEKFLDMPIGKALEWHAWCQQASRGRMIYLPIFRQVLAKNNLYCNPFFQTSGVKVAGSQNFYVTGYNGYDHTVFGMLDEEGKIKQLKMDNAVKEGKKSSGYKQGEELELFFDSVMNKLFTLSKDEIMCFYPLFNADDNTISHAKLKHLVEIDKKVSFLHSIDRNINYSCRASYSLKNMCMLFREGLKTGALYVFPYVAIPLILARLPYIIGEQFCQEIVVERIVQKNAEKRLINAAIESLGDKRLLKYCRTIKDEMSYSYTDFFKISLPILLPSLAIGCLAGENEWHNKGKDRIDTGFVGCFFSVASACLLIGLSVSPCVQSNGALGISLGLSAVVSLMGSLGYKWGKLFKPQRNSVECKDIAQLVARRDIVVQ